MSLGSFKVIPINMRERQEANMNGTESQPSFSCRTEIPTAAGVPCTQRTEPGEALEQPMSLCSWLNKGVSEGLAVPVGFKEV